MNKFEPEPLPRHPHITEALIDGVIVPYNYCSAYKEDDRFTTPEPGVEYVYLGKGVVHRVVYLGKEYDVTQWEDQQYFWKKVAIPNRSKNG
jgi:hypothetical protein